MNLNVVVMKAKRLNADLCASATTASTSGVKYENEDFKKYFVFLLKPN